MNAPPKTRTFSGDTRYSSAVVRIATNRTGSAIFPCNKVKGHTLAGIAGSNSAGGMTVVCCQVEVSASG